MSFEILKGSLSGDLGGGGGVSSCKTFITPALPNSILDFLTCGWGIFTLTGVAWPENYCNQDFLL